MTFSPRAALLLCAPLWACALLLGALPARAAPAAACDTSCQDLPCVLDAGRCLLKAAQPRAAKELLRSSLAEHGESIPLYLLLAKAYLQLDNAVWTRRVLYQAVELAPGDCQARSALIWFHLQQAELAEARELLEEKGCPDGGAMQGRWHLLRGTLARYHKQQDKAELWLSRARDAEELYLEDQALMRELTTYARPDRPPPVGLRAELGGGFTSDGLAGSPSEAAHQEALPTPLMTAELLAELAPPWGRRARPLLDLELRSLAFTREEASDLSYLSLGLRPGVAFGAWRLFYHGQIFMLGGGDKYAEAGPRWYYETHRGELDWAPLPWVTIMAGAGRSLFREEARSRTELDASVGMTFHPWRVRLLAVLSGRMHLATRPAYDLGGGTGILSGTLPLGPLSLRGRLLVSFDLYPGSAGYFDEKDDRARQDLLLKGGLELWSPAWHGARLGASYELSDRLSTADAYEYLDHRALLRLRFNVTLDPGSPGLAPPPAGHVAPPYGLSGAEGLEDERIQDLLRQEDAARRGSSCVN